MSNTLIVIKIYIFVIIGSSISTLSQTVMPEFEIKISFIEESAKKYVNLHLVEDLWKIKDNEDLTAVYHWLSTWEYTRNTIINRMFLYFEHTTKTFKLYSNWRERAQLFNELQMKYLQKIVDRYYDKRRGSWPWPKVTFVKESVSEAILLLNEDEIVHGETIDKDIVDPIATEEDIDRVLRLHRPYETEEIKQHINNVDENSDDASIVKKYEIIKLKKIQSLLKAHYLLIRESLKGKRMSDLDYQAALFQGERVIAEMNLWKKHSIDISKKNHVAPVLLSVLRNDDSYRRYLNMEEKFFPGNYFYGFKNRYDVPSKYGFDFEMTSKRILGIRYDPMHELANDIRKFESSSNGFERLTLDDLPTIDLYLERFKTWSFWFPTQLFVNTNWFHVPSTDEKFEFMIKPMVNYHEVNRNTMFRIMQEVLKKSNELANDDKTHYASMHEKSQMFQKKLFDELVIIRFRQNTPTMWQNCWADRMIRYVYTLSKSNLLSSLTSKEPLLIKNSKQIHNSILNDYFNTKKLDPLAEMKNLENPVMDQIVVKIEETFDPDSNQLIQVDEQMILEENRIKILNQNLESHYNKDGSDVLGKRHSHTNDNSDCDHHHFKIKKH